MQKEATAFVLLLFFLGIGLCRPDSVFCHFEYRHTLCLTEGDSPVRMSMERAERDDTTKLGSMDSERRNLRILSQTANGACEIEHLALPRCIGDFFFLEFDPLTDHPAMSYIAAPEGETAFVHFAYFDGISWHDTAVATADESMTALFFDSKTHLPIIAFSESGRLSVRYYDGEAWVSATPPHSVNPQEIRIAISFRGRLGLAYTSPEGLFYAEQRGGWQITPVDENCLVEQGWKRTLSLAFDADQLPHIAYISSLGKLMYAQSDGTRWTIMNLERDVTALDLQLDSFDRPVIAFEGPEGVFLGYREPNSRWLFDLLDRHANFISDLIKDEDGILHLLLRTDAEIARVACHWINEPPLANAGPDLTVDENVIVSLDGSDSFDPDNGIRKYQWLQTVGTRVVLYDPSEPRVFFSTPDVGEPGETLIFRLTVEDANGTKAEDTCAVNVNWRNEPPLADAGPDKVAKEGTTVSLNGSDSIDNDDGIAAYQWKQLSGRPVDLQGVDSVQASFLAPEVGTWGTASTFELTVTDRSGLQDHDRVRVDVKEEDERDDDHVWARSGGSGTTCIIVKNAYGAQWVEQIMRLRYFRDRYLTKTPCGKNLIDGYYDLSDLLLVCSERNKLLKNVTKIMVLLVLTATASFQTFSLGFISVISLLCLFLFIKRSR
jgi:hypothetical protein